MVLLVCWNIKVIVNKENFIIVDGINGFVLFNVLIVFVMFWGGKVLFVWSFKGNIDESVLVEV